MKNECILHKLGYDINVLLCDNISVSCTRTNNLYLIVSDLSNFKYSKWQGCTILDIADLHTCRTIIYLTRVI